MDHAALLAKLQKYRIEGRALQWIKEFLFGRKQSVIVEDEKSSFQPVISGVPQGTVLGSIRFIIYINEQLNSVKNNKRFSFADDTKLLGPTERMKSVPKGIPGLSNKMVCPKQHGPS